MKFSKNLKKERETYSNGVAGDAILLAVLNSLLEVRTIM